MDKGSSSAPRFSALARTEPLFILGEIYYSIIRQIMNNNLNVIITQIGFSVDDPPYN
jgi:hypothetical protein